MKTLDELKQLRDESLKKMTMRYQKDGFRIQVGMGTCGIASGARPILNAFLEQIELSELKNVTVTQVGCMGECAHEPMAEIIDESGQSYIYCALTIPMVRQIVERHIVNHQPITKYLLSERKDK
ncbi:(2Fe-2S) ferredoxin domain-containing protein [Paracholeplasma manati]|jgi:NADP-reducing hydrogenase subunit HndB|uniref:(2Fe-2S) ferredoxin domain-containing protein n=1 Tax=Paracholeplasma manati TaxID=591373 RepID=A0ABT2Y8E6_9MOLU|nr:(2Fe-2S) ferredoxin domain-containing protein [Paracholeplasma manati]MCV2232783.1 (2Fe-2S) ferredoxin domain-containing protein [Paracholeplasma manati]MDG0887909.1 (2Fe-2S) ferredoxin domain-containing protein [Paracholeplasma manati]MDX9807710.1 (2Fe-2S) ferredoxin domain-containing protein [Acholeplasma sp.]